MARLTTKGVQAGMPVGGKPELDRMDIAASCSRLEPLHFHLIMAKYCDDVRSALQALGELQEEMIDRSSLWADMDPGKRLCIASAIIEEFVADRKCRKCKGRGDVLQGSSVVTCKSCDGSGQRAPSIASRARSCGIPESTFRHQRLNESFQDMMGMLCDIEISALSRISRKAS